MLVDRLARSSLPSWALALALVTACAGGDEPLPPAGSVLRLRAEPESISVRPGESRDLEMQLVDADGRPVPERVVLFSILENPATPEDEARGATLASDRGVTDAAGMVSLRLIAGEATVFQLRASTAYAAELLIAVFVQEGTHGAVEAVPRLEEIETVQDLTTIRVHFFDGGACPGVRFEKLPNSVRGFRAIPIDGTVRFSTVKTEGSHALVGVALDRANVVRAGGCVDVPGAALLVQEVVRVALPLHPLRPSPEGRYRATSTLKLPGATAAAAVADVWKELSECPHDPARLWLDCTVDAVRTDQADPLDCRPVDTDLVAAAAIERRRGLRLPRPVCRDRVDAGGRPSLEALAELLFPMGSGRPPILSGLAALAGEARQLLELVRLESEMTIARTSARDVYSLDHRLVRIALPSALTAVTLDAAELGAPVPQARAVAATLRKDQLTIDRHGITARLGTAARLAFERASLAPRGSPPDTAAFVAALHAQARWQDRDTVVTGCAALDALLAQEVGAGRGAYTQACVAGQGALARRLSGSFLALDGSDLDLLMEGSAPIFDTNNDRKVDALGRVAPGAEAKLGVWWNELRARGGPSEFGGSWTAERIGD